MTNAVQTPFRPPVKFDIGFTVNRQGKPALDCQFNVPRLLGTTASVSAEASVSSLIAHSFNLSYRLPSAVLGWSLTADAVKQVNDFVHSSSFSETVTGGGLGLTRGRHRFGLDAHLRDINPLISLAGSKLVASEQIRRVQLRTVKTCFTYKYTLDAVWTIPNTPHPVGGYKVSFAGDLAGLFGDVKHVRVESGVSAHKQIFHKSVVWHSRIGTGAVAQLGGRRQTPIQDRFFLGGTLDESSTFRGFAVRSLGPAGKRVVVPGAGAVGKSEKLYDHLGGDVFVSIDNAVSFPLYSRNGIDIRGIAFGQIGSLVPTLHSRTGSELVENVRASVGLGVQVPVGNVGLLELSVGKPVYGASASDTQQLLHVGIRLASQPL